MSAVFLVDEDLPRSTAKALRTAGFLAEDVRDAGLRGHADNEVFNYAQARAATLITADLGFTNPWRFPPHSHAGIIVVRLPNELPTDVMNRELLDALTGLVNENLQGVLVIVEVGRIRIRRPGTASEADAGA